MHTYMHAYIHACMYYIHTCTQILADWGGDALNLYQLGEIRVNVERAAPMTQRTVLALCVNND